MEECYYWYIIGALLLLLLLYTTLELHYFLRTIICVVCARLFKKRVHILDTTTVTGICLTNDVDTLLFHMNNARYLRELDFARVDFYERSGLYSGIKAKGGAVVQGACTVRYRRFIRPFSIYKIESKIICWDDKSVFMEHQFVTPRDNFINAIVVCRQRIIDANAEEVMKDLLSKPRGSKPSADITVESPIERPEVPMHIQKWIEFNDLSSASLRKNDC
ncbi:protein THEM6-like [Neocloeon triangulifer]|uniref:protein THEM6-like n=1 Tax=Neocloeon triangulifer TaxID=2078957 RepID=UPI00286F04BA|nr:protein THEM6-like [Neocloeon triangulifer]XP_059486429.1 protein THEM6-like [Neocloeon triangulifer]